MRVIAGRKRALPCQNDVDDSTEIAKAIFSRLYWGQSEKEAIKRISRKHGWPGPYRDSLASALARKLLRCPGKDIRETLPRHEEGPGSNEPADKSTSSDLTRETQGD